MAFCAISELTINSPVHRFIVSHLIDGDSLIVIESDDIGKANELLFKARGVSGYDELRNIGGRGRNTTTPWKKPLEMPEL